MPGFSYQAVVLAGGEDKRLFPLTSATVKALLPVANKPLISYPLRTLSEAGLKHVYVVVCGEKAASTVAAWIQTDFLSPGGLQCEVVAVPEDFGTADALRAVASKITSSTLVVLSGDVLTDVPINALVASHQINGASATMLVSKRKVSPASETKPGKPPKGVDYIGLDPSYEHLLFYTSSPETLRDLKLSLNVIKKYGSMTINSDLVDARLYVFNRSVLALLNSHLHLTSLRQDLLPLLTQQQFRPRPPIEEDARASMSGMSMLDLDVQNGSDNSFPTARLPGANYMALSHHSTLALLDGSIRVQWVEPGQFCARVSDVQAYGEVNREVADSSIALHLTGMHASKQYDNILPASTLVGNKTTVGSACVIGEHSLLGDKASIKRSVLGSHCKLGANVKVINSVLMDHVVVGDGCTIQNCVICAGVHLKDKATVKDCQIGPGYVLAGGIEYKGEVLAKTVAPK